MNPIQKNAEAILAFAIEKNDNHVNGSNIVNSLGIQANDIADALDLLQNRGAIVRYSRQDGLVTPIGKLLYHEIKGTFQDVVQNGAQIVEFLINAKIDRTDALAIVKNTSLKENEIEDAVYYLESQRAVSVVRAAGKQPAGFSQLLLTGEGKNWFYRQKERTARMPVAKPENETMKEKSKRVVFVVHGRNEKARDALFEFLRSVDLYPLEWSELVASTRQGSPYIGEVLDIALSRAQAIIVLMTPDDEARLRKQFWKDEDPSDEKELTPQARPNVLFEAGMAFGHDPRRTVLVELGNLRRFSDVGGRHVVRLDNSTQSRQAFAQRLESIGCEVNIKGTDWHTKGNFEGSIKESQTGKDVPVVTVPESRRSQETAQISTGFPENVWRSIRQSRDEWIAERDSDPHGINGGKNILERISREILLFKSQIPEEEFADLHKRLAEILRNVKTLLKHQLYADGGKSFAEFWEAGDRIFQELDVINKM